MIDLSEHGIGIGGNNIKGIQRGTATVSGSQNITLPTAVDTTKSIVLISVTNHSTIKGNNSASAKIISSTQIQVNALGSAGVFVSWVVIEFKNVKSLQTGNLTISANTNVTVGSVDINKSLLFASWKNNSTSYTGTQEDAGFLTVEYGITSSTQIFFTDFASNTIEWQLIEF